MEQVKRFMSETLQNFNSSLFLNIDYDLPMREDYSIFVASLLENTIIT